MKALFRQRGREMPIFVQLQIGEYFVSVTPSKGIERQLIKSMPFHNGDDIWFDITIQKNRDEPRKSGWSREPSISETLTLDWELYDRDEKTIVISSKKESYHIDNKRVKKGEKLEHYLIWQYADKAVFCTIKKAIHIGRLWEFHRYDLRVETSLGKEIISEFTILNTDEHGENFHLLIRSLLLSALLSFMVSFLTTCALGRR